MTDPSPTSNYKEEDQYSVGNLQIAAYMFAGLAMMLNIRLSYSAAPFALLRFKLPENLFSVFVRTTSSALELWCLPSMTIGNIMEQFYNHTQNTASYHTSGLQAKANDIQSKATELKGNATVSGAGNVDAAAGTLKSAAETLSTHANTLSSDGALTTLRDQATELANAAKKTDGGSDETSLHYHAQQLQGNPTDANKAKAVIVAFNKAKGAYETLAKQALYQQKLAAAKRSSSGPQTPEGKVKAVDDAWKSVDTQFQALCKALIKEFAGQVETNAKNLAGNGGQTEADNVIKYFDVVAKAYNALDKTEQGKIQSKFDNLQTDYSKAIYKYKFHVLTIPSIITNWLNFLTFVILLIVFVTGGDQGHVTGYYVIMAISGFVFGINMVLVYAVDYRYLPFYMAGENSFPMVTSLILYFATSIFGNRRKYNSDYLVVVIDVSIAILIAFVASVLWTMAFHDYSAALGGELTPDPWNLISPVAMVIVGMGLVYSIYPGIAPGMIVPFYLIDKIEMVLLVATAFPPVIIAILRKYAENWSPSTKFLLTTFNMGGWKEYDDGGTVYGWIWHFFDVLIPLKIALAIIFVYSLHYRDSAIARSIINQPKMSTFLTIVFYMCHEILLALGFPGMVGNGGAGGKVMLPVQYVGALLMVFLAFYSIGYITEYKKHDPSQWPTEGMTKWNALCYWLKMASKITNKNFKQLFTTDLRRDLLLCIQKNELI